MAGFSKGKFYCWADKSQIRCLAEGCAAWNHVVSNPRNCKSCGVVLHYKCRRRLHLYDHCPEHRVLPTGPSCTRPLADPPVETLADSLASSLSPQAAKLFSQFLHAGKPHELLMHLATRSVARVQAKVARGQLNTEEETNALRSVAYALDKAQKIQALDAELNPPKLGDAGAYDYGKLTPEQLQQLEGLLSLARVEGAAGPAGVPETLTGLKQGAKQGPATAAEARWPAPGDPDDDPLPDPVSSALPVVDGAAADVRGGGRGARTPRRRKGPPR